MLTFQLSVPGSESIEKLHPAYFAVVMSTGIVSIAFDGLGFGAIGYALFVVNIIIYGVLLAMFLARLATYFDVFYRDLTHPHRCWGFLTFVVGTNTLGSQFVVFHHSVAIPQLLWVVGLVSWVALIYAIFIHRIAFDHGPIERIIDGSTLLAVVSTQSVTVLGSQIAETFGVFSGILRLFSLTHFAAGWVLYLIIVTLVTYRLLFRNLAPEDWTGPYWIAMGAVAITTLAGSNMLLYLNMGDLFEAILVVTYLAWAIGAWWIPILLYLDVWKFYRLGVTEDRPWWITVFPWLRLGFGGDRYQFYEPPSWGRVFPMGMFTAATIALSAASGFEILFAIPSLWGWFALIVWGLTSLGTLRSVKRTISHN